MNPDSSVQTAQEGRSLPGPIPGSGEGPAVCLRSPRGGKLRVVRRATETWKFLRDAGWAVASGIFLSPEFPLCPCGCGLPVPQEFDGEAYVPLQKYADPETCRRAIYALMHPTLDLSGMLPEKAKQAARMAEEAVKAAKLGQARATVDARSEVAHEALNPDTRPSCRLRVTPHHFELLAEMKALGYYGGKSFSAIAMELIEREVEDCRLRAKQEGEHDV